MAAPFALRLIQFLGGWYECNGALDDGFDRGGAVPAYDVRPVDALSGSARHRAPNPDPLVLLQAEGTGSFLATSPSRSTVRFGRFVAIRRNERVRRCRPRFERFDSACADRR